MTGLDLEEKLGIVKIPSGTGLAQAKATFQLLTIWEVVDDTVGMCFDTTASNTQHQFEEWRMCFATAADGKTPSLFCLSAQHA